MRIATTHTTNPLHTFSAYRFHFNGKETDNEVYGEGNVYDYGFRIYNPRLGKFLTVDPLFTNFPWNSTYSYAENDVIRSIDLDGLEKIIVHDVNPDKKTAKVTIKKIYYIITEGKRAVHNTGPLTSDEFKEAIRKKWVTGSTKIRVNALPSSTSEKISEVGPYDDGWDLDVNYDIEVIVLKQGELTPELDSEISKDQKLYGLIMTGQDELFATSGVDVAAKGEVGGNKIFLNDKYFMEGSDLLAEEGSVDMYSSKVGTRSGVISHEIGHNFGLEHKKRYAQRGLMSTDDRFITPLKHETIQIINNNK